jgi:hypothetical protein
MASVERQVGGYGLMATRSGRRSRRLEGASVGRRSHLAIHDRSRRGHLRVGGGLARAWRWGQSGVSTGVVTTRAIVRRRETSRERGSSRAGARECVVPTG